MPIKTDNILYTRLINAQMSDKNIRKMTITNHSIFILAALCCICLLILPLQHSTNESAHHALIEKIFTHLEQPPKTERSQELQRWLAKLRLQHDELSSSFNSQSTTQNTKFHLSMATAALNAFQTEIDAAIQDNAESLAGFDFFRYTKHLAHLANTRPEESNSYLPFIQKILAALLLICICIAFQRTIPRLKKDIRRLEKHTRRHNKLQQNINSHTDNAVIHIDLTGEIHFLNEASAQMFNRTISTKTPLNIEQLLKCTDSDNKNSVLHLLKESLRQGGFYEFVGMGKNKHSFPCKLSAHPLVSDTGDDYILLLLEDISELKRLEEKSLQAQKMEALGHLTGGIGHDFNNLLLIIQGNLRLLEEDLQEEGDAEKLELLDDALSATKDGAQLTDRLLSFSRKQALKPESCDINALCKKFLRMIERALGGETTVELQLSNTSNTAVVDTAQLQNALLNLALNARDAMPNGGAVRLEISNTSIDANNQQKYSPALPLGKYVQISVSDSGTGISKSLQNKVFDPFFTTKKVGKGTGMGLSMVYGFAQQSNGGVFIKSKLGLGTEVSILLPYTPPPNNQASVSNTAHSMPRGLEHVLIVEDEDRVRKFTTNCLKSLGYTTTSVSDADAAHELLSQKDHGFHALFCDMIMPGNLSGPQLAEWVKGNRPELRTLMTTGYSPATHGDEPHSEFDVIYKPYSKKDLAVSLRKTLDSY